MVKVTKIKVIYQMLGFVTSTYFIRVENGDGIWEEPVGTEEQADIFIRGVQAGRSASGKYDIELGHQEIVGSDVHQKKDELEV